MTQRLKSSRYHHFLYGLSPKINRKLSFFIANIDIIIHTKTNISSLAELRYLSLYSIPQMHFWFWTLEVTFTAHVHLHLFHPHLTYFISLSFPRKRLKCYRVWGWFLLRHCPPLGDVSLAPLSWLNRALRRTVSVCGNLDEALTVLLTCAIWRQWGSSPPTRRLSLELSVAGCSMTMSLGITPPLWELQFCFFFVFV